MTCPYRGHQIGETSSCCHGAGIAVFRCHGHQQDLEQCSDFERDFYSHVNIFDGTVKYLGVASCHVCPIHGLTEEWTTATTLVNT